MSFLFARDGHLLELGIDGLLAEELSAEERVELDQHLATCGACRARLDEARALAAQPLPPLRRLGTQDAETEAIKPPDLDPVPAANNNRLWVAVGGFLAMAAALAIFVLPQQEPTPDTFTARGGALSLEVYKQTEGPSQLLLDGDQAAPGDTLGFRVRLSDELHLSLVGADSNDAVYAIWPPKGGSAAMGPMDGAEQLPTAIQLDATPGVERILAVACDQPFRLSDDQVLSISASGEAAQVQAGCVQELIRIDKVQP